MKRTSAILQSTAIFIGIVISQSTGNVAVGDVPACARACLSNSTAYATDCAQIDVKCLCTSSNYVSALSCCLSQNCNLSEQQTAIQFNIQECAAVNSSAPNFVGCSPFSLSAGSGGGSGQTTAKSVNSLVSTINGDVVTELGSYSRTKPATATFAGKPLLTGSCSVPLFAQVTDSATSVYEFPQVGCGPNRESCCPFDSQENAVLTVCPQDYFTTSGACCPLGFQVYYAAIGAETPCYSNPSLTLVPASTPTVPQLTVITDHIFSRRYLLATSQKEGLSTGAIVGIATGSAAVLALLIILFWYARRRKSSSSKRSNRATTTFPPEEPALAPISEVQSPQELASPAAKIQTPATPRTPNWPMPHPVSSPPAYEGEKGRPISLKTTFPQELPGSTHIHEHHPAFTGSQSDLSMVSPPRTPNQSATGGGRSPVLSASSPLRTASPTVTSITSLGSPRFREGTM